MIKQIKINDLTKENQFKLAVLGDLHIGDKSTNYNLIEEVINWIKKEPNCFVILNGDIINNGVPGSKSDPFMEGLTPQEQIDRAVELLTPLKDRIILITSGNHEFRTYRLTGLDPTATIAARLGLHDRYCESSYLTTLYFGKCRHKQPYVCNVFGTHGARGGGRKIGNALNTLADLQGIVTNSDIIVKSHTHQNVEARMNTFVINGKNNLELKETFLFNAPAFISYSGYGQRAEFRPCTQTFSVIRVRGVTNFYNEGKKKKEKKKLIIDTEAIN